MHFAGGTVAHGSGTFLEIGPGISDTSQQQWGGNPYIRRSGTANLCDRTNFISRPGRFAHPMYNTT